MPTFCVKDFSLSEKKPRLFLTGPHEAGTAIGNKRAHYKSRMWLMAEGKVWRRCTKGEPAWHTYPAPDGTTERHAATWCLFALQ